MNSIFQKNSDQLRNENPFLVKEYPWIFAGDNTGLQNEFVYWYHRIAEFRRKYIDPVALDIDKKMHLDHSYVPRSVLQAACEYKLFSSWMPKIVGGAGIHLVTLSMLNEQVAAGCLGLSNLIFVPALAIAALISLNDAKEFMPHLREIVKREKEKNPILFALATTESSGGTDLQKHNRLHYSRSTSKCEKVEGGYLINGQKVFISDAGVAEYLFAIFWKNSKDRVKSFQAFFIPLNLKGITVGKNENKMGVKASPANEIAFDNCFVPDKYSLSPVLEGEDAYITGTEIVLGLTRSGVGAMGIGAARSALAITAEYAQKNKSRGKLLIEHDWVKHKLVKMWKNVMSGRILVYGACVSQKDFGLLRAMFGKNDLLEIMPEVPGFVTDLDTYQKYILESNFLSSTIKKNMRNYPREYSDYANDIASNAKVTCSELAIENAKLGMEICGIEGMRHDRGLEKIYRDGKLLMIYEGTNQICDLEIYEMSGDQFSKMEPESISNLPERAEKVKIRNGPTLYENIPAVAYHFLKEELSKGSIVQTVLDSILKGTLKISHPVTFSELLEKQAENNPEKVLVYFEKKQYTFGDVNQKANQFAHFLHSRGFGPGSGLGIMMSNSIEFLYVYYACQKLGMYCVPINTALVGQGLQYIINHSEIELLVIDKSFLKAFQDACPEVQEKKSHLKKIVISQSDGMTIEKPYIKFEDINTAMNKPETSDKNPAWRHNPEDISTIMYTSGTTGLPKGVVYRYKNDWVSKLGVMSHLTYKADDILYTCLPLFHANALFVSMGAALWLNLPIVIARKFSASNFWDEIKSYNVTTFNAIGAMIPILLKQPAKEADQENKVRLVMSAACPASRWREFEERFNLTIWEGYGAVDGGGQGIANMGNAPVGSFGRPMLGKIKIINDNGEEVKPGETGELLFESTGNKKAVEYFKNDKATESKMKDGFIHTGDLVYSDAEGFLYFVGRKTESMRRRGENVSAFEVEEVISKHPKILECAVFGVNSEMGEDDIMCVAVPLDTTLKEVELIEWLEGKLARFAIPRYIRFVKELPKTGTHRVQKKELQQTGLTADTYDSELNHASSVIINI